MVNLNHLAKQEQEQQIINLQWWIYLSKVKFAKLVHCLRHRHAQKRMDEIFRWMYDNLDMWSQTDEGQDEAILIIRKGLVNHVSCADAEINLSATLVELSQIGK